MTASRSAVAAACAALFTAAALPAVASDLYFDFNDNVNTGNASLFLFGTNGQTVSLTNNAGFSQNVVLGAQGFASLPIANTYRQVGTGVTNFGFHVQSSQAIAGYFINRASASTDMTYLLDGGALGRNYVVASQGAGFGEGSQVAIHATQDNTQVTFTPRGGSAVNVTLNAGQTYKYAGGANDLTGSSVAASKPVAVFSGHACAQVPVGTTYCDTLLEQAIPTDKLSRSYLLTASSGAALAANRSDLVRVVATENGTEVKRDGAVVATIAAGEFYEFSLLNGAGTQIDASAPVEVAQYLTGGAGAQTDPAFSYVPGADTWLKEYRLATPSDASAFDLNYASLVIPTAALGSLELNGVAVSTASFSAIGASGFSRGIVNLPLGLFNLTADDEFLVMLGGGSAADSYFTYGGSTFAPGISPPPPPVDGIPEPSTYALLGAGLGLVGWVARRRKR